MTRKFPCSRGLRRGAKLRPQDVDPKEFKMGLEVEREHTTSARLACGIALDHLAEHGDYYTRLTKAKL